MITTERIGWCLCNSSWLDKLSHGRKPIFEPTTTKTCHGHDSKGSYKNFILWGISKKDGGSDTTYAKGPLCARMHRRFRQQAIALSISLDIHSIVMKYTTGLHAQINTELRLFKTHDFTTTSVMAVTIEKKNRTCIEKNGKKAKGSTRKLRTPRAIKPHLLPKETIYSMINQNQNHERSVGRSNLNSSRLSGRTIRISIQQSRPRRYQIELAPASHSNPSLSLMARPKDIDSNPTLNLEVREKWFTLKILV